MADNDSITQVREIIEDTGIALLTHVNHEGRLVAKPMATQEVEFDGTVRFIAQRDSAQVQGLQQRPEVNVSYSGSGAWVSLTGTASVVDDADKLEQLWDTFTDAWLTGGPTDPNNVLVEIDTDTAEYWDAPGGSKVTQVANLVKAKTMGERATGDNEVIDL